MTSNSPCVSPGSAWAPITARSARPVRWANPSRIHGRTAALRAFWASTCARSTTCVWRTRSANLPRLPAQQVKLENRGLLRTGYFADITIFNPATVKDVATFEDPNRTSMGFEYVFVNGVLALEHDKVTGQMGGRPLRGPGYAMRDYLPDGLPPKGKLQGVVTDSGRLSGAAIEATLTDASGKVLGTANIKKDGRYEIVLRPALPCAVR